MPLDQCADRFVALIDRKSMIKGQLTRIFKFVSGRNTECDYYELNSRLSKVNELYNQFIATEDRLFQLDPDAVSEMEDIDDQYFPLVAKIHSLIRMTNLQPVTEIRSHKPPSLSRTSTLFYANPQPRCPLCTNENHKLFTCTKFRNQDIDARRKLIKRLNRCFNCLSDEHIVTQCKNIRSCQKCNKRHNSLLHLPQTSTLQNPSTSCMVSQTACYDSSKPCQTNCSLSENSIESTNYQPMGANYIEPNRRIIPIRPTAENEIDDSFVTSTRAYILPTICSKIPAEHIDENKLHFNYVNPSADPKLNTPTHTNVSLCCEQLSHSLTNDKVTHKDTLITLKSRFSWFIGGSFRVDDPTVPNKNHSKSMRNQLKDDSLESVQRLLWLSSVPKLYLYSDTTPTLDWLSKPVDTWKQFVTSRTFRIFTCTNQTQWHHVSLIEIPADGTTRRMLPKKFCHRKSWIKGPEFLLNPSFNPIGEKIKLQLSSCKNRKSDYKLSATPTSKVIIEKIMERGTTYHKLTRIALLLSISRILNLDTHWRVLDTFRVSEIREAEFVAARDLQEKINTNAIKSLKKSILLSIITNLISFFPFPDDYRLIRVGDKLEHSIELHDVTHPVVLPAGHPNAEQMVKELHIKYLHSGPKSIMSGIAQKFLIRRARNLMRRLIHQCINCRRHQTEVHQQLMGQLLPCRVNPTARAFVQIGNDLAGPFTIKTHRPRRRKLYKSGIIIFVCMATGITGKATKLHLSRSIGEFILIYEKYITFRKRIEALHDSRSLEDLHNGDYNLPISNRFLTGQPTTVLPEPDVSTIKIHQFNRWLAVQSLLQGFWNRWSLQYIISLTKFYKWHPPNHQTKTGILVLTRDQHQPLSK